MQNINLAIALTITGIILAIAVLCLMIFKGKEMKNWIKENVLCCFGKNEEEKVEKVDNGVQVKEAQNNNTDNTNIRNNKERSNLEWQKIQNENWKLMEKALEVGIRINENAIRINQIGDKINQNSIQISELKRDCFEFENRVLKQINDIDHNNRKK